MSLARNLPVGSTTASLHPVLNHGSKPSTVFHLIGGVKSKFFIFSPNTLIAASSAHAFLSDLISLSIEGSVNLINQSWMASFKYETEVFAFFGMKSFSACAITNSSQKLISTLICFSFSALDMARYA
jgi:hypothetical protein